MISRFLKILFFGNETDEQSKPNPYYEKQTQNLKDIWYNKTYNDFGIERLFRLFLQLTAFIIPSGVFRQLSGTDNIIHRRLTVEFLGIGKVFFYYLILVIFDKTQSYFFLILTSIITFDTLHFLASRIFLNDVFRQPISYKRSLLMVFINYVEICLFFAFVYSYIDHTNIDIANTMFIPNSTNAVSHISNLQSIYFSFVTSATIGYGDIVPKNDLLIRIVIFQVIISLFLVVVIISNVTTKIEDETFYNKKN
ncbi:MAG: potassium channel family protein [Bacteroidia bacterium]|nr:potassium channel family protein [Bacteroidia bacterium]